MKSKVLKTFKKKVNRFLNGGGDKLPTEKETTATK